MSTVTQSADPRHYSPPPDLKLSDVRDWTRQPHEPEKFRRLYDDELRKGGVQ